MAYYEEAPGAKGGQWAPPARRHPPAAVLARTLAGDVGRPDGGLFDTLRPAGGYRPSCAACRRRCWRSRAGWRHVLAVGYLGLYLLLHARRSGIMPMLAGSGLWPPTRRPARWTSARPADPPRRSSGRAGPRPHPARSWPSRGRGSPSARRAGLEAGVGARAPLVSLWALLVAYGLWRSSSARSAPRSAAASTAGLVLVWTISSSPGGPSARSWSPGPPCRGALRRGGAGGLDFGA